MINLLKKYITYKIDIVNLSNRIKKELGDFVRYEIRHNSVMQFPIYVSYTMKSNDFYTQNQLYLALELGDMQEFNIFCNMRQYYIMAESVECSHNLIKDYDINIKLIITIVDGLF